MNYVLIVCVIMCLGDRWCLLCGGGCCTLVNSVIDALVEEGDLDPNAEVDCVLCINISVICCAEPETGCYYPLISFTQFEGCGS